MKTIVKLTERDLSRIVKRVIKEHEDMGDVSAAMSFLDSYLKKMGGTLGRRRPHEIMADLKALEHAIRVEKNNLDVASKRPNPNWGSEEELDEGWLSNLFGGGKEEKKSSSSSSDDDGERREYYKCGHLSGNDTEGGFYYDKGEPVDVLYIGKGHEGYEAARNMGYFKQGSRYGGEACKGELQDIF